MHLLTGASVGTMSGTRAAGGAAARSAMVAATPATARGGGAWRRRRRGGGGGGGAPSFVAAAAAAAGGDQPAPPAARRQKNAGLYDLDEEAGWGVAVVGGSSPAANSAPSENTPQKNKQPKQKKKTSMAPEAAAALAAMPEKKKAAKPAVRMPYVDLASQAGVSGLEMLRQSLAAAEEADEQNEQARQQQQQQQGQQQQQQQDQGRRALLEAARRRNRADQQPRAKLPGMAEAAAAALAEREARLSGGRPGALAGGRDDGDAENRGAGADEDDANDDAADDDDRPPVPEFTVTYSGDTGELESFKEKDPMTGELREARAPWQRGGRRVFVAGDDDGGGDGDSSGSSELGAFGEDLLADALGQYGGAPSPASGGYVNANNSGNVPLALAAWQDVLEEVEMAGGWEQLEALPGGALETGAPAFRLEPAGPGAVEDFESTMGSAALFREAKEEEEEEEGDEEDDDHDGQDWRGPAAAVLLNSSNNKKMGARGAAAAVAASSPPATRRPAAATIRQSAPLSGLARPDRRREVGADAAFYAAAEDDEEEEGASRGGGRRGGKNNDDDEDDELDAEGRANGPTVVWGGTGGVTGLDLEEQAAVLARYFQPSEASKLLAQQRAADAEHAELRLKAAGKGGGLGADNERRLHRELRILAGSAAGRSILSSRGETTRPMMAKVRGATFSMVAALSGAGSSTALPATSRWLDLFAGTGSIGIEALSRGAREVHFVEMDPWVARRVLAKNIASCGFERRAVTHTTRAEDFLRRALGSPRFAGGAFDYVSVCPPYLLVSYPELFDLLEHSPLLGDRTVALVEYPKQLSHEVRATLGPLRRVRDRKYGRTYLALYAGSATPAGAAAAALAGDWAEDGDDDDEDGGGGGGGGGGEAEEQGGEGGGFGGRGAPTGWEI